MLYPIVGAGAEGARLHDVDGNEYVDITMGFGVHLFGHEPDVRREPSSEQLGGHRWARVGACRGGGRAVCELTGMERATFCNSGTEA